MDVGSTVYNISVVFVAFSVHIIILLIGWYSVWECILVKIPIVREVCGIDEKRVVQFPTTKTHPTFHHMDHVNHMDQIDQNLDNSTLDIKKQYDVQTNLKI